MYEGGIVSRPVPSKIQSSGKNLIVCALVGRTVLGRERDPSRPPHHHHLKGGATKRNTCIGTLHLIRDKNGVAFFGPNRANWSGLSLRLPPPKSMLAPWERLRLDRNFRLGNLGLELSERFAGFDTQVIHCHHWHEYIKALLHRFFSFHAPEILFI